MYRLLSYTYVLYHRYTHTLIAYGHNIDSFDIAVRLKIHDVIFSICLIQTKYIAER